MSFAGLGFLIGQFGHRMTIRNLSSVTGLADQTIRNGLANGNYPIESFRQGQRRLFVTKSVAEYLAQQNERASWPMRFRGRPSKVEQSARRKSGSTK